MAGGPVFQAQSAADPGNHSGSAAVSMSR
jgi:hypothetical protein